MIDLNEAHATYSSGPVDHPEHLHFWKMLHGGFRYKAKHCLELEFIDEPHRSYDRTGKKSRYEP